MRPPEQWHQEWPVADFGGRALVYRRTLVQLKGGERDAFVVRDQYASPEPVSATYSLHVLGGRCERRDRAFEFDGMTLHVASPSDFAVDSFDWSHENGGPESTKGLRLTTRGAAGEFVTVLVPRAGGGAAPAVAAIPGGVRVGEFEVAFGGTAIDDDDATAYVVVKRAGRPVLELTGRDVDLDRDQGRVGLFVPDAGYPFGEIPDWLIRQRAPRPDWAPDWARRLAP
jgi:hypothetical protein